jgi:polysaccharide biosynthesis protein PelD
MSSPGPELEASDEAGRRWLGVRVSAIAETLAFLAVALAADFWFGSGQRFTEFSPHPFWIIVLLASVHYGTNEGLAAAALCAVVLLAGNMPEQGFDEDRSAWLLRVTADPVLWILASLVLGEIRSAHQRRHDSVRRDLAQARRELAAITEAYQSLTEVKNGLEVRVAAQLQTVQAVYRASRSIERQDIGEVLVGIVDLVRAVLAPRKFSVFLLNGSVLEAGANEGWRPDDRFTRDFEASSPLFQAVVGRRQVLVVADPAHEAVLAGEGLLAGPLVSEQTGEIVGMLKIEQTGFKSLNLSSIQHFRILCDWIGTALANAQRVEVLESGRYLDPVRQLLPLTFFERQRALLADLAREIGFDACALFLGFDLGPEHGAQTELLVARSVARAVRDTLSLSDLRFDVRQGGWGYAVLLPGADRDRAETIAERLVRQVCGHLAQSGVAARPRQLVEVLHQKRSLAISARASWLS